jgi:hypothetical protein
MVTKFDRLSQDTLDFLRLQDKLSKKFIILNIRGKIPLVLQIVGTIFFFSGILISPRESKLLAFLSLLGRINPLNNYLNELNQLLQEREKKFDNYIIFISATPANFKSRIFLTYAIKNKFYNLEGINQETFGFV